MITAVSTSLNEIRTAIDSLDARIVGLIAERQAWVVRAGELKRGDAQDSVRAPARVDAVIAKVRALAEENGAVPDVVERTYRAMIDAFIELEISVHAKAD